MIIKDIYLKSFGKFKDKDIRLKKGMNLIYGNNESGKTTLHRFIEGMFFGFFKPYSKNKIYTPEYAKYSPWNSQEYRGTIVYESKGREYRLERNFSKNSESVKLFDNRTGEDLSGTLAFDPSYKLPKGNKHININNVLFRNTVSIGQLANVTDDELAAEIGDLFVNIGSTQSAGVSLKAALEALEKQKAQIGTKNQSKSPLGKYCVELNQLESQKELSAAASKQNKVRYALVKELEEKLEIAHEQKGDMKRQRERLRLATLLAKFQKYSELQKENESLKSQIISNGKINESMTEEYDKNMTKIEMSDSQLKQLKEQQIKSAEMIEQAKREFQSLNPSVKNIPAEEIASDKTVIENTLGKLAELDAELEKTQNPAIAKKFQALKKQQRLFSFFGIAVSFVGLIALVIGLISDSAPELIWGGGILAAVGLLLSALWGIVAGKREKSEKEFQKYDTEMSRTTNMILMCNMDIERHMKKYECATTDELTDLLSNIKQINAKAWELDRQIALLSNSLKNIKESQISVARQKTEYQAKISSLLEEVEAESDEEFKIAVTAMREQAVIKAKIDANRAAVAELLGDMSAYELAREAKVAADSGIEPALIGSEGIEEEIEENNRQLLQITSEIASIKASIAESERSAPPLNEIMEAIAVKKAKIAEYEEELSALSLASEKILLLSKDIHNDFAETFNDYISDMISAITKGKYTRVLVNDKLEIKIEDKSSAQLVDVSSLSGGTIDQIYFAVRFAIMDLVIKDKKIPVFLDDCLLQYDETRMGNILSLIHQKAKDRQIVMFSCRSSEKNILDEKGYDYHYIDLSAED